MPAANIKNGLYRLSKGGRIRSVWQGFYTVSLPEYGLSGNAPPSEYIDQLFRYLGAPYYVALLSAAALEGASHEALQVFQVMCGKHLRDKKKSNVKLEMIVKKAVPSAYLVRKNVNSGTITVSVPELTAIDLLLYPKRAGGISHIATVLSELAENLNFEKVKPGFFSGIPAAAIQRLGFLLDEALEEHETAEVLLEKAAEAGIKFRRAPLTVKPAGEPGGLVPFSQKWKLEINYDVEIDV
jgi:predicted transcriptional regulator of viral defense system